MRVNLSCLVQSKYNIILYLAFGWKIARIYIFVLGKLYFYFNRYEKNSIENAVLEVIRCGSQETDVNAVTKKVFAGILSHYYEKLFIAFEEPKKATKFLNQNIDSEDLVILKRKLLKGNGVIIVTAHYGAIEYIPTLLAVNNFPISMIAKFKTEQLKKKVYAQAKEYNIRLIDANSTDNVLRSAIKELKENRILVTQCDEIEEWRPSAKETMSFLGRITAVDRTISIIQKRTRAEIIFALIHRHSLDRYKLFMRSYEYISRTVDDISPTSVGKTVLKFLEQNIYANPEQWYQWKKYLEIKTLPPSNVRIERPSSLSLLKPKFGKVS